MDMDRFASQRKALAEEIPVYRDREPVTSKPVGIILKYPSYSDLTADQLEYYTFWKNTIGTPEFKKAGDGYLWLFICETINGSDRKKAGQTLNILATMTAHDGSPLYPELLDTAIDFSLVFGTPMPEYAEWMYNLRRGTVLPWILSTPVTDIPLPEANITSARAGFILRRYDSLLQEKKNITLKQLCLEHSKTACIPFENHVLLGRKMPVEFMRWNERSAKTFDRILRFITDTVNGKKADPTGIPMAPQLTEIIDNSANGAEVLNYIEPLSKTGQTCRILGTTPTEYGPSCLKDPFCSDRTGARITLGDILTFGPSATAKPADFITSDIEHPVYDDLSKDRFAYYSHWKNSFRKGRYLDTDNGYVNLFLSELINSFSPEEAFRQTEQLLKVYGTSALIAPTLADLAHLGNRKFEDYRVYLDRLVVNNWIDSYVRGMGTVPLDMMMLNTMRSGNVNVRFMGTEVPLKLADTVLRQLFTAVCRKKGPEGTFGITAQSVGRSLFFGLNYMRGSGDKTVHYINYLGCRKFLGFVDKTVRFITDLIERYSKNQPPAKSTFTFAGVNCANIILDEFLVWWSVSNKPAEKELKLDLKAIEEAESDLRSVTEMMKVDEEPEEETVIVTKQVETVTANPWKTFILSLDDNEREYLGLCIEGKNTRPFLKEAGITAIKIEDSINNKALDTVGDTVIENGTAVEDYLEDLKEAS